MMQTSLKSVQIQTKTSQAGYIHTQFIGSNILDDISGWCHGKRNELLVYLKCAKEYPGMLDLFGRACHVGVRGFFVSFR